MTDLFQEPDDATPLDPALRGDLIQTWITTRADLNEAEEGNIVDGAAWARRRRGGAETLLNEDFSKSLQADVRRGLEMGWRLPPERTQYRHRTAFGFGRDADDVRQRALLGREQDVPA